MFDRTSAGSGRSRSSKGGGTGAKGFIHTVYKDRQWVNELEEGEPIGGVHATKEEAVEIGRARARQDETEHVIHNQDGTIGERNSYGNDPASRPG